MNKIIKYLKQPKLLILTLSSKGYLFFLPSKLHLKIIYRLRFEKKLDLENPSTFNEKIQWLKLNDKNPLYTKLVDKSEVKKYVSDIIGEEYIIPTIGVYDKFDDINFDKLPSQFVIKCTHDSGGLVICKSKGNLNLNFARRKINKSLRKNYYYIGREWPYKNVKPKIIVEKLMVNGNDSSLKDYKFYCFNGEPKYLYVSEGLINHDTARISFFDMNFKRAPFSRMDYKPFDKLPDKPQNFDKMKEIAKILSKDIPFVRVDLYEVNNKVYFSELTFSPCGGYMPFYPVEWDKKIGDLLILP